MKPRTEPPIFKPKEYTVYGQTDTNIGTILVSDFNNKFVFAPNVTKRINISEETIKFISDTLSHLNANV